MRKSALVWMTLAVISGAALFLTSQKVTDGRTKLDTITARTAKESEALRVLETEWAYLNQPGKLEKLVKQYLDLAPLKGKQFGKVTDFAERTGDAITSALPAPEAEKTAVEKVTSPTFADVIAKTAETPAGKPAATAAEKPVVKIIPAAAPPAVRPAVKRNLPVEASNTPKYPPQPAAKAPAPKSTDGRDFGDLMKSLGVQ